MTTFTRWMYGLLGTVAIASATAALISPRVILSDDVYTGLTAHLVREQAAGFVFIGLMFFWCLRHFESRGPVHAGLLVFTTIFAGIHWWDYLQSYRDLTSPLANSVPSLLLLMTFTRHKS